MTTATPQTAPKHRYHICFYFGERLLGTAGADTYDGDALQEARSKVRDTLEMVFRDRLPYLLLAKPVVYSVESGQRVAPAA